MRAGAAEPIPLAWRDGPLRLGVRLKMLGSTWIGVILEESQICCTFAMAYPGMNIATAAAPMTAAAIQPRAMIGRLAVKRPITDFLEARMVITTSSGTATTPLITALQNKAFIGLSGEYWMPSAANVLTAM